MITALLATLIAAQTTLPSTPDLGKAAGRCRAPENGPSFLVSIVGLKDRRGLLKIEVYPDNDDDFLSDDNKLVAAGKPFSRVEVPASTSGPVQLCIRVPRAGRYAVSVLHDRDGNRKFGLSSDGIGFAGNPKLSWSKPHANEASAYARNGPTPITIVMNYRHGLLSFGPIGKPR
ncbi:DUF2141 domain-containing protein [Sphingomonas koreensis]|nr:DUF2141 domain-containing protein [Sphingomonas koreensis]